MLRKVAVGSTRRTRRGSGRDHRHHSGACHSRALIGGPVGLIAGALIGEHLMGQDRR